MSDKTLPRMRVGDDGRPGRVARVVSPEEWATRIPWHTKAGILAALDRAIEGKRAELDALTNATGPHYSRNAHSAYTRGERTPEVIAGERAYQRNRRRRRASCPDCGAEMRATDVAKHVQRMHQEREAS